MLCIEEMVHTQKLSSTTDIQATDERSRRINGSRPLSHFHRWIINFVVSLSLCYANLQGVDPVADKPDIK